jgi:hypothetical protein
LLSSKLIKILGIYVRPTLFQHWLCSSVCVSDWRAADSLGDILAGALGAGVVVLCLCWCSCLDGLVFAVDSGVSVLGVGLVFAVGWIGFSAAR